ncbi:MAG: hypothetical protein J0I77_17480 [Rudaea sp.]|uniref:hypothetical protein n=1 Tax=unclassified Rudaea TaxID=2627037 RepID=UPI0010F4ECAF|nr:MULTISPECIES: hypothetical protein [unclassified Rudaea]MBN8887520.1 hypothetical protein [Rudaea sp.]MBR0344998.1 hypothetical protein [Rudaea sp.]
MIAALRGFDSTLFAMLASSTPARTASVASLPSSANADGASATDSVLNEYSADMACSSVPVGSGDTLSRLPVSVYSTNRKLRNRHAAEKFLTER